MSLRVRLLVTLIPLVAGAAIAIFLVTLGGPSVDQAAELLATEGAFESVDEGADAFAEVGDILTGAGERCDEAAACDRLLEAAAYARVAAVRLLDCTLPGLHEARSAMRLYVAALDDKESTGPPPLPDC